MSALPEESDDAGVRWYADHVGAGHDVVRILSEAGSDPRDKRVVDVGCGDGIIDLAIACAGAPAELVGFDVNPTDTAHLLDQARRYGEVDELPPQLRFEVSEPERVPADDGTFDIAGAIACDAIPETSSV